jgi:exopolysaccharide biosynthesis polyprenyl glycosylphosphotransferase
MSSTRLETQDHARTEVPPTPATDSRQSYPEIRRRLVAGDAVAALLAWLVPFLFFGDLVSDSLAGATWVTGLIAVAVLAGATLFTLAVLAGEKLYRARVSSMRTVEIARIARAALVVGMAALVLGKFLGEAHLVRVPVATVVFTFLFLNFWRASFASWLKESRRKGRFTRPVLLIGTNAEARNFSKVVETHPELGYRFIGVIGSISERERHEFDIPYLGDFTDLRSVLRSSGVRGAIVIGSSAGRGEINSAVRQLLASGVHVHMSTGINGIDHRRLRSHSLGYEPFVYVERVELEGWQLSVKRVIDVSLASTVLLLTAPVVAAAVAAIKLSDRGPALFRQERVGRNGKPFHILKLRSMVADAEDQLADLREHNERKGPLFKLASDPRVTRVGNFLRATSIDELPQLVNVIRGDMSLVGPRPALSQETLSFDEDLLHARNNVLPGITGLWQVEGRDNPDFAVYQRLDLFYVENWSVALDLSILTATARVVLSRAVAAIKPRKSKGSTRSILA